MKKTFAAIAFLVVLNTLVIMYASAGEAIKTDMTVFVNGEKMLYTRPVLSVQGRALVPAKSTFEKLGAEVKWDKTQNKLEISKNGIIAEIGVGSLYAKVNGSSLNMGAESVLLDEMVMIPIRPVSEMFDINIRWNGTNRVIYLDKKTDANQSRGGVERLGKYTVVIDAGHGGSETGAEYAGVYEKNLNINIARKLYSLLVKDGFKVYMTRVDDSYVGLYERSGLANKVNADLFVSIHNNAGDSGLHGTMTLYYPSTSPSNIGNLNSLQIARIMQNILTKELGTKDLGVVERPNLAVLRTTEMPALLAEVAFMTDNNELKLLETDAFLQKAADALDESVKSILNYK